MFQSRYVTTTRLSRFIINTRICAEIILAISPVNEPFSLRSDMPKERRGLTKDIHAPDDVLSRVNSKQRGGPVAYLRRPTLRGNRSVFVNYV